MVTAISDYGAELWWNRKGQGQQATLQRFQRLQNQALLTMLGAFRGSPHRALEIEAAIPPPAVRFEKQCDLYCIRALRFLKSHPIKLSTTGAVKDELGGASSSEDNTTIPYLRPTTQLLRLLARSRELVGSQGFTGIEKTLGQWEEPWQQPFPATFTISEKSKEKTSQDHSTLLQQLADPFSDYSVLYYTDGSKGYSSLARAAVTRSGPGGPSVPTCSTIARKQMPPEKCTTSSSREPSRR